MFSTWQFTCAKSKVHKDLTVCQMWSTAWRASTELNPTEHLWVQLDYARRYCPIWLTSLMLLWLNRQISTAMFRFYTETKWCLMPSFLPSFSNIFYCAKYLKSDIYFPWLVKNVICKGNNSSGWGLIVLSFQLKRKKFMDEYRCGSGMISCMCQVTWPKV